MTIEKGLTTERAIETPLVMRAKYPRFRVRCVVRGTRIRGLVSVASSADAASRRTSFLIFFLSFFLSFFWSRLSGRHCIVEPYGSGVERKRMLLTSSSFETMGSSVGSRQPLLCVVVFASEFESTAVVMPKFWNHHLEISKSF